MTRPGWWVIAALAACSSREDAPPPVPREVPVARPVPIDAAPSQVAAEPPPPPRPAPAQVAVPAGPVRCLDEGIAIVSYEPPRRRACFDTNADLAPDQCARWSAAGALIAIDPVVEASGDEPEAEVVPDDEPPAPTDRARIVDATLTVCAPDRACVAFMPARGDDESVHTPLVAPDFRIAAALISGGAAPPRAALWDVERARLRATPPFRNLAPAVAYELDALLAGGSLVLRATDPDGHRVGSLFGLDGRLRADLAEGSRAIDVAEPIGSTYLVIDDASDEPHRVYLYDLAAGRQVARLAIARDVDRGATLEHAVLPGGVLALWQWAAELRLVLVDLRTRTSRTLTVPRC